MRAFRLQLALCLLALLDLSSAAGVMGIDFGTDWYKVALVKSGVPLELVLNRDSQRKTDAVVTIRDGQRIFGIDGVSKGLRFPQLSYGKLKSLLGRRFDDPAAADYREAFDNIMVNDTVRGTCLFEHTERGETTLYSVEELVAMQLSNARKEVEDFAGEPVRDAVITVPPYWTQHERQALLDAASMADIRVLSLMSDETAVALNYALAGRNFNSTPQHHIFYDMGAGSTVAALISFQNTRLSNIKRSEKVTEIEVKAIGYDRTLGGNVFDKRLQELMAKHFDETIGKKRGVNIYKSHRAMAKLLKEANKVKHILSANNECTASIEGLVEEIDFRMSITREKMIELTADVFPRLAGPINDILKTSKLSLGDVQSFILVGGSIRVPAVQDELQKLVGAEKIAKHVNQDEAAVLGAAFRGASILPRFRVKEFDVKDIISNSVNIHYASTGDPNRIIRQNIFRPSSTLGSKLKLSFKHTNDFGFHLEYSGDAVEGDKYFGVKEISNYTVSGLDEVLQQYNKSNVDIESKVKVTVSIADASGLVTADEASVEVLVTKREAEGGIVDSVLSFFGGKDSKDDGDKSVEASATANETTGNGTTTNSTAGNSTTAETKKEPKPEIKALKLVRIASGIPPFSEEMRQTAIKRAKAMDDADRVRRERDSARNTLESFIYNTVDVMSNDNFIAASTDEERDALSKALKEESEWLDEHGSEAATLTADFKSHLSNCDKIYAPIRLRIEESKRRPDAMDQFNKTLSAYLAQVEVSQKNDTATGFYITEGDLASAVEKADEFKKWLAEQQAAFSALGPRDTPKVLVADIHRKTEAVNMAARLLKARQRIYIPPPPPKPPVNETATAKNDTTTTTDKEAGDKEEPEAATESGKESAGDATAGKDKDTTNDDADVHDEL